MEEYLRKFDLMQYTIPGRLWCSRDRASTQIVAAWFLVQTETRHTYLSLSSCRAALSPGCSWDAIGTVLKMLLDRHEIHPTFLPLHAIGHGNTTVILGHSTPTLMAVKQQLFTHGSWEVSSHILEELRAYQRLSQCRWSPTIFFQVVSQDMVQVGMEYLPLSLKQMVRFGGKTAPFVRQLAGQLLRAVEGLHALRMAHRDIKPENIRFRSNGELVLLDYDSCISLESAADKTRQVCTAAYRDPYLFQEGSDLAIYDYRQLDAFSTGAVYLSLLRGGKHVFAEEVESQIPQTMRTYVTTHLTGFCQRRKLTATDTRILSGLLALDPGVRMSLSEASRAHGNKAPLHRTDSGCLWE